MNDIEVLIKRLGYIEESYLNNHYMSIGNFKDIDEAINLLKERQADKERIKELEAQDLRKDKLVANFSERHFHDREKIRDSIPKSLIKEKIEELNEMIIETHRGNLQRYTVGEILSFIRFYEELLEGKG